MSTVLQLSGPARGFGCTHLSALPLVPCDPDASVIYNLESFGENQYRLTLAVPGFTERHIGVSADRGFLRTVGETEKVRATGESLHQGLRSTFRHNFLLLQPLSVIATEVRDGLLRIDLERDAVASECVPEPPIIWEKVGELGLAA